MPTSLLSTDTMFPNFKGNETTEEKVDQIQNYLYMLVEQLRYSMANIGAENFNETEFDNIVNLITEPIYFQLTSEDGTINQMLHITEDRLISKIEGVTKDVEALGETTTLIQQTVNSITSSVSDLEGNYSKIRQSVDSIDIEVTNLTDSSVISLTRDGALVKSQIITLMGVVKFEDLMGLGTTSINGSNITTGTIKGVTFMSEDTKGSGNSGFFVTTGGYARRIGGIRHAFVDGDGVYGDKMYLYTQKYSDNYSEWYPSVKIESAGNISIEAPHYNLLNGNGGAIYINAGNYLTIVQGSTQWTFKDGGLYKNSSLNPIL